MKNNDSLSELINSMPEELQIRSQLSISIAHKIEAMMAARGYSRKQFAEALGRRPSEITKWLSGEHNFTISTLARLGTFFGEPVIRVPGQEKTQE